jgi:hypothetical protein
MVLATVSSQNLATVLGDQNRRTAPISATPRLADRRDDMQHHACLQWSRLVFAEAQQMSFAPIGRKGQADGVARSLAVVVGKACVLDHLRAGPMALLRGDAGPDRLDRIAMWRAA